MKKDYDEPLYIDVIAENNKAVNENIEQEIAALCSDEPFAVLATEGNGQPLTSLISFAVNKDLRQLVFSTPLKTQKHDHIIKNSKVSILVDNRSLQPDSINAISGVTINGRARILEDEAEIARWAALLIAKHRYLEKFVNSPSSRLVLVERLHFFYVRRFQEVFKWVPSARA